MTTPLLRPRTLLAIADAWLKLDPESRLVVRQLSPALASNLQRLSAVVRASGVRIELDDPHRTIEAERRATYLDYPLSTTHEPPMRRRERETDS